MSDVLNPVLYRKLKSHFGAVKVSNKGEAFICRAVAGVRDGSKQLLISHAGEYYQVCCPFCGDTRFRLYINHMFNRRDGHGRRMTFLAVCYNEGCLNKADNREHLLEIVDDTGLLEKARIRKGVEVREEAREVLWPGLCMRIDELRPSHKAVEYLAARTACGR
jgi:hypothetical protein